MHGIAYLLMLLALCALIWLAGRAVVEACIRVATNAEGLPLANAAYLSIAVGAGVMQILTWLLVDIHLFSFRSLLIALVLMVLIALATLKNYRNILLRPRISLDATSVAYAAGMLAFIASVGIDGFWSDNATILYIQQGWNLYRHMAADIFPHFGAFLNTPIFYTGDVVSSVFGFLSHLDHERYRVIGIYVINVLLAPAIPVGAYLVFRKFLSTLPAIVAALAFCTINLGPRVWSLRGESIGWIVGL